MYLCQVTLKHSELPIYNFGGDRHHSTDTLKWKQLWARAVNATALKRMAVQRLIWVTHFCRT